MQVQNSNLATVLKLQDNCTNLSLVEKFTKSQVFVEDFTNSLTFVELLTKAQTFVKKISSLIKNSQAR